MSPSLAWGFLLLPLIGGFLFLQLFHWTRFYYQKAEGNRLFFAAAFVGAVLLLLSRILLVTIIPEVHSPLLDEVKHQFKDDYAPFAFSGTATGAVLLGLVLPLLLNLPIGRARSLLSVARKTDELLYLLLQAQIERAPVLITLDNRKAYVGFVLDLAYLGIDIPYFKIVPMLSGHRDQDDLSLELTTVYQESLTMVSAYADPLAKNDGPTLDRLLRLQIILKRDTVISISFFNERIYQEHYLQRSLREGERQDLPEVVGDFAKATIRALFSRARHF